jgi:hypothetical protein
LNPESIDSINMKQRIYTGLGVETSYGRIQPRCRDFRMMSIKVYSYPLLPIVGSMAPTPNEAGPSRPKQTPVTKEEPQEDVDDPRPPPSASRGGPVQAQAEEGDEDEERMDFKTIESIAR